AVLARQPRAAPARVGRRGRRDGPPTRAGRAARGTPRVLRLARRAGNGRARLRLVVAGARGRRPHCCVHLLTPRACGWRIGGPGRGGEFRKASWLTHTMCGRSRTVEQIIAAVASEAKGIV